MVPTGRGGGGGIHAKMHDAESRGTAERHAKAAAAPPTVDIYTKGGERGGGRGGGGGASWARD